MKKIIASYTKGLTKTIGRLNNQQKGLVVISLMIGGTLLAFLITDSGGSYSLDTNPMPGKPYAIWPTGHYLDYPHPYYYWDQVNVKKYCIPIVVTWEADNGIMWVKVRAQKLELFSTYETLFSGTVDWGDATRVVVAYNLEIGVPHDHTTPDIRVKLEMKDLKGLSFTTSESLKTDSQDFLDHVTKDGDYRAGYANDPSAKINYDLWIAGQEGDPDSDEPGIPDPDPYDPAPDYTPPAPPSAIGITDLFIISSLAVTTVVYYKKKRKIEV